MLKQLFLKPGKQLFRFLNRFDRLIKIRRNKSMQTFKDNTQYTLPVRISLLSIPGRAKKLHNNLYIYGNGTEAAELTFLFSCAVKSMLLQSRLKRENP